MENRSGQTVARPQTKPRFRQPGRLAIFSSLKHHNFRYLWVGTFFASAGDWIQQVTLGWLIYELTDSALLVGTLQAARMLPTLVVAPISGVFSDRMDRRKLLMASQVYLACMALGLALLIKFGHVQVWHLFAFTTLTGMGFAMNNPLRQALVANTVPREGLSNAVALNSMAFNINRVLGPGVAGLLIGLFGPGNNFLIQSVCYVGAAAMVFPIRLETQHLSGRQGSSPMSDLREGLAYVFHERTILALVLMATIPWLTLMPFTTGLLPVFSKDVLHQGPQGLGLLFSLFGIGGMLGTLIIASLGTRSGVIQVLAGACSGLALIGVSRSTSMAVALPLLVVEGIGQMVFFVINNTVLQTIIPDSMRGRVSSIYMLSLGIAPLGSVIAGIVALRFGAPTAMLIGGGLTAGFMLLVGLRLQVFRRAA